MLLIFGQTRTNNNLLLIGFVAFSQVRMGQSCCSVLPIDCRSNVAVFYPFSPCRRGRFPPSSISSFVYDGRRRRDSCPLATCAIYVPPRFHATSSQNDGRGGGQFIHPCFPIKTGRRHRNLAIWDGMEGICNCVTAGPTELSSHKPDPPHPTAILLASPL